MAKGYVIAQMSVVNQEGYLAYAKQVPGTFEAFGGRFLCVAARPLPWTVCPRGHVML